MITKVKKMIPEYIKGQIISKVKPIKDPELEVYRGKKKIIVALGGFYQNLGDMAITFAQKEFLKRSFPDYEIILYPSHLTYLKMKALKNIVTKEDIITTVGGGNMDESYPSLEDARRFIIKSFPENRIISFPQTITFSDTEKGKKRLKKTIDTYSKHKDLTIFARERNSFEKMKMSFPDNKVKYCPDIVMSLNKVAPELQRKGVTYCVRNDLESRLTEEQKNQLLKKIESSFHGLTVTDTVNITTEQASPKNYEKTLNDFWTLLKKSEVVITDRLHCMIFCAITKTPCIVLPNSNQKIKGTYTEWLYNLDYIKFIEEYDINEILSKMKDLKQLDTSQLECLNLEKEYGALKEAIISE